LAVLRLVVGLAVAVRCRASVLHGGGAKRYGDVDQIMIRDIFLWVMLALLYL
jgi:hypothetical protein